MKNVFRLVLAVMVLGIASCKKEEGITPTPFTPGTVILKPNSPSQFHASIDGVPFTITLDTTYIDTTSLRGFVIGGDTLGRVYKSILKDTVRQQLAAGVFLGMNSYKMEVPGHILPTPTEFNAFFTKQSGYFPFGDTTVEKMQGAAFFYRDTVNNVMWTTQGPQPGSSFRVDTIAPLTIMGQHHIKARMTFQCKLYDGNGAVRNLTNGVFIGIFRNG